MHTLNFILSVGLRSQARRSAEFRELLLASPRACGNGESFRESLCNGQGSPGSLVQTRQRGRTYTASLSLHRQASISRGAEGRLMRLDPNRLERVVGACATSCRVTVDCCIDGAAKEER